MIYKCDTGILREADYCVLGELDGVFQKRLKLDSGAQHTLVNSEAVRRDAYTGELLAVRVASGQMLQVPMAMVTLHLDRQTFWSKVGVMKSLQENSSRN